MSDAQWQHIINAGKVMLAFVNAFAGALAAYPGPELSPLVRLMAVAVVAGCGGSLLVLHPPGASEFSPEQVDQIAARLMELEREHAPHG